MIWAERAVVTLILASLAGAVHLVISIHRRALNVPGPVAVERAAPPPAARPIEPPPPQVVAAPPRPRRPEPPRPRPAPAPAPPAEDPTKQAVAELADATAREIAETKRIDARAVEMEKAREAAVSGAKAWRRREMLVKQQLSKLVRQADQIDRDVDALAAQRDVLAGERDALKAARAKAPGEGSFAVLPYKGENGTWRRPIVLECANGSVTLRPNGPTFSMLDLSGLINPRSSPVIVSIARELLKIQGSDSPDGSPVVPYFVFLVRPDGVRPYYEARARLEPLGIAFGYELIDQDLKVDVPDFDDIATWDGSTPINVPPSNLAALGSGTGPGAGSRGPESTGGNGLGRGGGSGDHGGGLSWPGSGSGTGAGTAASGVRGVGPLAGAFGAPGGSRARGTNGEGQGSGGSPDDFVWPSSRGGSGGGSAGGDAWSAGSTKDAGRGTGAGASGGREPDGAPGAGLGSGPGTAFEQLPPLEPAGPSPDSRGGPGGGLSAKPPGGAPSGTKPGAIGGEGNRVVIQPRGLGSAGAGGEGVGLLAGGGLKALADGYEAGRPRGTGGGPLDSGDRESQVASGPMASGERTPRGAAGPGPVPEAGANAEAAGPLVAGDRKPRARVGAGSVSEPGGGAGAPSLDAGAEPGGSSAADLAAAAGAVGKPEPGLMWGGGSSSAGAPGAGVGGNDPGAASGLGSTGGAKALLGLGASRGAANAGGRDSAPAGVGLGLGSLGGATASSGGGGSKGSSSSGGGSGLSLGSTGSPSGSSSSSAEPFEDAPFIKDRDEGRPSPAIEVPFEIVVACGADGLVIHPGGYRITERSLKAERKDSLLVRQLVAVAVQRAETDPSIRPRPRVSFLVENNGGSTFWEARRQVLFAGLDWPMTLHVAGTQNPRLLNKEAW